MASLAVSSALPKTLTFAGGTFGGGLLGFAIMGAAGFLDQRFLYPAIAGDKSTPRPRRLLDIPQMTAQSGSPRIWSIGRRVRVPLHVLFQSDKVREQSVSGMKGGVANSIRRVFSDVGLALNERHTENIAQLIGSGKLLYWSEKNLQEVTTSGMTASVSSGDLLLTMDSNAEPDFFEKFDVDDRVQLRGWEANGGPDINAGYWRVVAVTKHGATPSTLTLDIYGGQTLAGLAATAGDAFAPATVERVDDAFVEHDFSAITLTTSGPFAGRLTLNLTAPEQQERFERAFGPGDRVKLQGYTPSGMNGVQLEVVGSNSATVVLYDFSGSLPAGPYTAGTSSNAGVVRHWGTAAFIPNMFAADPGDSFHHGTTSEAEEPIYARHGTTGQLPTFRGMSTLWLDQFDLSSHFGNQLPLLEGIIEPDTHCTFGKAIELICLRSGIRTDEVDVSGVTVRPFEGYYLRGAIAGNIALQPVLVAGQIATQERDDKLAFFDIENADVVPIENGESFSDLGAVSGRDTPNQADKILRGELDDGDLVTRLDVKFMDVDNVYAQGSEPFGLRNPGGTRHQHEDELDLSTMALTRKQARNLAATVVRRTWVNSQTVEVSLPVAYQEILENDLITVTDDDGHDVVARVIRREEGANFLVNIVAVREQVDLAVVGSPVQGNTAPQPVIVQAATPVARVLDIPPLLDAERLQPGYYFTAASPSGANWSGVSVFESLDGGTTWSLIDTLTAQGGVGVTVTSLPPGDIAEPFGGSLTQDNINTLTIQLEHDGPFPLTTVTEADVAAGFNWIMVHDGTDFEILGAIDITDNGGGEYELSNLLRGLRGTHYSAENNTLAAGSEVTLLTAFHGAGKFRALNTLDLPASVQLKFVPAGKALADVDAVTVSVEGWNARPMPVRDISVVTDGSDNRTFTFHHWSRVNHPVGYEGPWALDEAHEGYRMRIYADDGTTLLRVKHRDAQGTGSSLLSTPTFTYTAAEQATDNGVATITAGGPHWVEIEQLGDFGINAASGSPERAGGRTYRQQV